MTRDSDKTQEKMIIELAELRARLLDDVTLVIVKYGFTDE